MRKTDQHSLDTIQLKAWTTRQMKNDVFEACRANRIAPTAALRRLVLNYSMVYKASQKNG